MNGYERFMTALDREEPDQVPLWELIINEPTLSAIHGNVGYLDFCEKEELDGVCIFENQNFTRISENTLVDEWGITHTIEDSGLELPTEGPINSEEDLASYEPPTPNTSYRLNSLREAVSRFKGEKAIVFLTHEGFEFSHYLHGMDNLFIDYIENPKFVHELAQTVIDYKLEVADAAIDAGADVIVSGDDYASRTSPIMSPSQFEEFCLPYLQKVVDLCKRRCVPHIKHTDGNIWPIIDMIVDTGTSALDPLEPIAGMDIGVVKEKYGDRVAVIGNVDCTGVLPHGDTQEVIDAVKETIAKASPGGGHILASSNSIHPAVKPENYHTMVKTAREFGKYPLDRDMVEEYSKRNYVSKYMDAER